jgi:SAM-dependent methyltransferase
MKASIPVVISLSVTTLLLGVRAVPGDARPSLDQLAARPPDVPFVVTPPEVVTAMLDLAAVGPTDVLYDLGSGDGRIPIAAAQRFGIRAVGIDIDPLRIREARERARAGGVEYLVSFHEGDMFEADLRAATVVTLYLLPRINQRLRPKLLAELAPGARIVSHRYDMGDWAPAATRYVGGRGVFLWIVPRPPRADGPR